MKIEPSTRTYPGHPVCECGNKVMLVIHHDLIESHCSCGESYFINVDGHVAWNCCSKPTNDNAVDHPDNGPSKDKMDKIAFLRFLNQWLVWQEEEHGENREPRFTVDMLIDNICKGQWDI